MIANQMSQSKKIDFLFVIPTDSLGGGTEQLLFNVADYLLTNNLTCYIIFLSRKKYKRWEAVEKSCTIKYLPFSNVYLGYLMLLPLLTQISVKYSIKHTFTSQTLINGLMGFSKKMGLFRSTKIIVRESNSIFHLLKGFKLKIYAFAYHMGYSRVDLVICQTEYMKKELLKSVPWMEKKLKLIVLNNPINMEMIGQLSEVPLNKSISSEYIVAAGRLSPVKGFDILIKAFGQLTREFPELRLLILGEGNEKDFLEKLIVDQNMENKIELIGFVENVYPYFKAAKLCVMSSRIEGFPNVLLQMMSQNNKVVSTISAGGIDQIDGLYTCETNDPMALYRAIKDCLEADTRENRFLFDKNLQKRTLNSFVNDIKYNLD